jgi:predicted dehydrogenase
MTIFKQGKGTRALRGAILGCGQVAYRSHFPVFAKIRSAEILAVFDKEKALAERTAAKWGIPSFYNDLSLMLDREKLDFVDICLPPKEHAPYSLEAMRRGINVIVEKPLADGLAGADSMIASSRKNNVKLCEIQNFLYVPSMQKAQAMISSGLMGDVISMDIRILDRNDGLITWKDHWCHDLKGGILENYCPHAIYLVNAIMGKITSLKAFAKKKSAYPWVKADELKVIAETERGLASIYISCNSPRSGFFVDIEGTKRILRADNYEMSVTVSAKGMNRIKDLVLDDLSVIAQTGFNAIRTISGAIFGWRWTTSGHGHVIRGFLKSILGDSVPPVPLEESRAVLATLQDIWKQIGMI